MDFWETLHASPQYWEVRKRFSQPTTSTMKNYKAHVTKGPAHAKGIEFVNGTGVFNDQGIHIAQVVSLNGADEILIAEAFNVLHDTGFTPGELAEQARELRTAMEGLFEHHAMVHKHWGSGSNAKEAQAAEANARAILAKYQPVKD